MELDYRIGSVHYINDNDNNYFPIDMSKDTFNETIKHFGNLKEVIYRYYDNVIKMIETQKPDIIGHLDLVRKYSREKYNQEEFIEGKELTIPVMEGEAFPPIWIRPKKGFYNYENKYTAGMTEYLLDTGLSASRLKSLKKLAVKAYNACGCRSMARIDFIATDRKFYVIEVNTVPGMTATSLVPKSASKLGISFEDIVKRIAESASLDNK